MTGKEKKSWGRRMVKKTLWSLLVIWVFIVVVVGVGIHFIFTPAKLTPWVEKTANAYLDADVRIGNMELTFFLLFRTLVCGLRMFLLFPVVVGIVPVCLFLRPGIR